LTTNDSHIGSNSQHRLSDQVSINTVEHPFHIVKNLFRHKKLRYRGLAKNTAQLRTLFALANLVIAKKTLLAQGCV
jgi:IS5 family transposase